MDISSAVVLSELISTITPLDIFVISTSFCVAVSQIVTLYSIADVDRTLIHNKYHL